MRNRRKNAGIMIAVAILLIIVTLTDTWMVFQMTASQTMDSGIYRLKSISGELESTINDARQRTAQLAMSAQLYLDDLDTMEAFIYKNKELLAREDSSCFNLYIGGPEWAILPELENPEDFVVQERIWYIGAVQNNGSVYVTAPYVDVVTGNICYTVSVMLSDQKTVLAVDYTMDNIREHIAQMHKNGVQDAVIVTEDGVIAGSTDESLVGKLLSAELPDYSGIFSLAKNKNEFVTLRRRNGLFNENLFATGSGFGWYLIVRESDWELYKDSYIQLLVMVILSIALLLVIIGLYIMSQRSQKKAEQAFREKEEFLLNISGELRKPLREIADGSGRENIASTADYGKEFERIHHAADKLTEMIEQIISYSNIIRSEQEKDQKEVKNKVARRNTKFRSVILVWMFLVMIINMYMNVFVTYKWGNVSLKNEVSKYENHVSEWINTQKSILDMYCSVISTNPDMLKDYDSFIAYLDRITVQYPEIAVSYLANPEFDPSVYMNNGWKPGKDVRIDARPWYVDTLASDSGWSVSAPYYDLQTGIYCVTMSERVYDAKTGEFLGIFGIDFYMDKLVNILGSSYSDAGYAFLVDGDGNIVNHPYGRYQMSKDQSANVSELVYGEVPVDGKSTLFIRDYDGAGKLLMATSNYDSKFSVYVVSNVWNIYGRILMFSLISLFTFLLCIVLVHKMLTDLIRWQDETNAQLKEAADTAIAAGRSKSQFLAQMSHEIRTPINAVLGMNEMILRESKEDRTLEYASNIRSAGKTLLALINSILDFSKIEDGKMEIIAVNYDVATFINNLVNSISERARAKDLELKLDIDGRLPSTLSGDDVRLTQVIMNLLTNAVKYTEKGTVTLGIQGKTRKDDEIELLVKVQDTGIGIKQEDMDRLFESFERIEEKRNRNIEGTGLGMSIVTKLLEMMGSHLDVRSQYGQGSVFSFTIRQMIVDSTPLGDYRKHLEHAEKKAAEEKMMRADQAKVLVVDDNTMNLKVFQGLIKRYGIVPDTAVSGKEAIRAAQDKEYDMIFLDHMMPQMDGMETLAYLRDRHILPESTVVIALTANAVVGARETYIEAGFHDYLSKPIELDELEKLLAQYLPRNVITYEENTEGGSGVQRTMQADRESAVRQSARGDDEKIETEKKANREELMELLRANGIDTADGIRNCADDQTLFFKKFSEYIKTLSEREKELSGHLAQNDFKAYENTVRTLKNTSKTIGAKRVSDYADRMEQALQYADTDFVKAHHADLISRIRCLSEVVNAAL